MERQRQNKKWLIRESNNTTNNNTTISMRVSIFKQVFNGEDRVKDN